LRLFCVFFQFTLEGFMSFFGLSLPTHPLPRVYLLYLLSHFFSFSSRCLPQSSFSRFPIAFPSNVPFFPREAFCFPTVIAHYFLEGFLSFSLVRFFGVYLTEEFLSFFFFPGFPPSVLGAPEGPLAYLSAKAALFRFALFFRICFPRTSRRCGNTFL